MPYLFEHANKHTNSHSLQLPIFALEPYHGGCPIQASPTLLSSIPASHSVGLSLESPMWALSSTLEPSALVMDQPPFSSF